MRSTWVMGALLGAACLAAQAQTYEVDITMAGLASSPITFSGSFTFDSAGTGFCSAAFCGPGITPGFADVLISDPLSIDAPDGPFAFTGTAGGANTLSFFDTYWGAPGQSSFVYQLTFTLDSALGGPASDIALSNIYFATDNNVSGFWSCGGPARLATPGVSCTTATLTEKPSFPSKLTRGDDPPRGVPEPGTFSLLALALAAMARTHSRA